MRAGSRISPLSTGGETVVPQPPALEIPCGADRWHFFLTDLSRAATGACSSCVRALDGKAVCGQCERALCGRCVHICCSCGAVACGLCALVE